MCHNLTSTSFIQRPSHLLAPLRLCALAFLLLLTLAACGNSPASTPTSQPLLPTPGKLTVSDAWARSVPVIDGSSAVYLNITNGLENDVKLLYAQTSAAGITELHETMNNNEVMSMQHMPDGWTIPAGGALNLAPGGKHIMLMTLAAPLADGDSISLALTFDNGSIEFLSVPVRTEE